MVATTTPSRPVVQLRDVRAYRKQTLALRDVSLSLTAGTLTAVIGPNGAGKSTLFGVISGRLRSASGDVDVDGPVAEVLQATAVDPQLALTVEDAVRMGRFRERGVLRPMRTRDREAVDDAIEATGLTRLRRRPVNQLSGGQRQRVMMAQGLAQGAPVLLLDEPATGLDIGSKEQLDGLMRREAAEGRTVVFSTHDLDEATRADTVVALCCECVCCAPPSVAFADPDVRRMFAASPAAYPGWV
jgi:ABC-type Mn2+/Zn2+ transport system ATPase subunit